MATLAPRIASAFDRAIAEHITARRNDDGYTWSVPSSDGTSIYTVDFTAAIRCTCQAGQHNHFCKHQAACVMGNASPTLILSWVPASCCCHCATRYYCENEANFIERVYCPSCRSMAKEVAA